MYFPTNTCIACVINMLAADKANESASADFELRHCCTHAYVNHVVSPRKCAHTRRQSKQARHAVSSWC